MEYVQRIQLKTMVPQELDLNFLKIRSFQAFRKNHYIHPLTLGCIDVALADVSRFAFVLVGLSLGLHASCCWLDDHRYCSKGIFPAKTRTKRNE